MYDNIKSCVLYKDKQSNCFSCMTGIPQRENVSPFYFLCFKRFRRLFQKFSWVSTRNCKGNT